MENSYKKILLDTNIISAMLRHPTQECKNYFDRFILNGYITCISISSIFELRKTDNLYQKLLNTFNMIPTSIIKPPYIVVKDEIICNNSKKEINPILIPCSTLIGETKLETFLSEFLQTKDAQEYENNMDEINKYILKQWYEEEKFKPNN